MTGPVCNNMCFKRIANQEPDHLQHPAIYALQVHWESEGKII